MLYKFLITALLLSGISARAQTTSEWFNQKETQIKYFIEQIAALQLYTGYIQKGYKIVKNGTKAIGDIKRNDINLHSAYFNSLKSVNASIKENGKMPRIIEAQMQLLAIYHKSIKSIIKSDLLSRGEINYCSNVYSNLINQSGDIIDALTMVTTAGQVKMKDDARIKKIEGLYTEMQDKLAFAKKFSRENELLIAQRRKEYKNIELSRTIYGIN